MPGRDAAYSDLHYLVCIETDFDLEPALSVPIGFWLKSEVSAMKVSHTCGGR